MDHIFRRKLYDYSEQPPMHLWDEIEATRTKSGRVVPLWVGRNWLLWAILIIGTSLAAGQLFAPSSLKSLDSFPVPVQLADQKPAPLPAAASFPAPPPLEAIPPGGNEKKNPGLTAWP